jgi:hypothetical protein
MEYPQIAARLSKVSTTNRSLRVRRFRVPHLATSLDSRLGAGTTGTLGTDEQGATCRAFSTEPASRSRSGSWRPESLYRFCWWARWRAAGRISDILLSRLIEIVICFPFLFLILAP